MVKTMNSNNKKKATRRIARILALLLAVCMVLSSGIYIVLMVGGYYGRLPGNTVYAAEKIGAEDQKRLDNLDLLLKYIRDNFRDDISYDRMIQGIYSGLMESLDDPWSEYYFYEETSSDQLFQDLESSYAGVGISLSEIGGRVQIVDVNRTGPSYAAGVRAGGWIVEIDGQDSRSMSASDMSKLLRGPEGTVVRILVEDEKGSLTSYSITRAVIRNASVFWEIIEGDIGYIQIGSFSSETADEFRQARLELLAKGANSLIIDIRYNGGGYLGQALDIADQLMDSGVISIYESQGKIIETVEASPDGTRRVPVVLLVNESTASASECLAAALQDNGIATVVGTTTYGKGVAQGTVTLNNGDSVKLTMFYFKTPNGKDINQVGVVPDVVVYSNGSYTETEAAQILAQIVPLTEGERYYQGEYGLNVLAAQQRLDLMGYKVEMNGILGPDTMAALRKVQKASGSYSYGNLDAETIRNLSAMFDAYMGLDVEDAQLDKAVEILKKK